MSWRLELSDLTKAVHGNILSTKETSFSGVGTDTRKQLGGKIFFALRGANFDAHDYLNDAVNQGAAALVVSQVPKGARALMDKVTIIEVTDVLRAMQNLAHFWRHKMKAKILAVTGTNGKTTTKEFAATILSEKFRTHWSQGSLNNHWGVPMSLLAMDSLHEVAVFEMGMNHPGEISELVAIAEPDVALVTMVGRGHLEGLGGIEGVAKAKEEMYTFSPDNVTGVFNMENVHTNQMYKHFLKAHKVAVEKNRPILFGTSPDQAPVGRELDVCLTVKSSDLTSLRVSGFIRGAGNEIEVPVFGEHNVVNLMAAACLALSAGMTPTEIWPALAKCQTTWGRNQWVMVECGAHVLFDAYNANPESMRAAVENFSRLKIRGRRIAFIGEMKEMGNAAGEVHRELGEFIGGKNYDQIVFVGPSGSQFEAGVKAAGFKKNLLITNTYKKNLAEVVQPVLDRDDIVLIKASRGMELERILEDLHPVDQG